MPSVAWLLDEAQVASVLTYIRNASGNAASAVSAIQVTAVKGHERTAMIDFATAPYTAFLLRVCLGVMFIAHALLHGVFTLRETIAFFRSVSLPGWFVYVIITVELAGGACLILGVVPRYVALLLIPEILGTIVKVHGKNGWLFSNKGGGWEYPAFLGGRTARAVSSWATASGRRFRRRLCPVFDFRTARVSRMSAPKGVPSSSYEHESVRHTGTAEGFFVAHFLTVRDQAKSREFTSASWEEKSSRRNRRFDAWPSR
jgi:putative oxidoreductase